MSYVTDRFDQEVVELLQNGAVGFMPTDTIYGLSCRALEEEAVERLRSIKGKAAEKPLIVLIADTKMLNLLSIDISQARLAARYWPGPLSLEFKAPASPLWLQRGAGHFAIRLPDYPELIEVIKRTGPLVSTSANLSGGEPAHDRVAAQTLFSDKLDFYVDVGPLNGQPSTLAIVSDDRLEVIRQGAVKIDDKGDRK